MFTMVAHTKTKMGNSCLHVNGLPSVEFKIARILQTNEKNKSLKKTPISQIHEIFQLGCNNLAAISKFSGCPS